MALQPAEPSASRLTLSAVFDRTASALHLGELLRARGRDLVIDASAVRRLSPYGLQVLLAARLAWRCDGRAFLLEQPSPELLLNFALMGLPFETAFEDEDPAVEASVACPRGDEGQPLPMLVRAAETLRARAQADDRPELADTLLRVEAYLEEVRSGQTPPPSAEISTLLRSAQELFDAVSEMRGAAASAHQLWSLHFRPLSGPVQQVVLPFLGLSRLGEFELKLDASGLPPLSAIDPECVYLAWSMTLRTSVGEAAIRRVFQNVSGGYLLDLRELGEVRPRR